MPSVVIPMLPSTPWLWGPAEREPGASHSHPGRVVLRLTNARGLGPPGPPMLGPAGFQ